ncbi:NADH dehydrogenase [ubiquinone] 1 alpha subcomplex subunit 11 isoform X2 [Canis lupus dingo]|uniref:NADH dehydrogenase [ubiquinone] 1 alpha subcomplex subunit 11 isoform X2 n=1 Tax=Canis lupus dingo TaxID=286419 RepID=UPI0020C44356|nr:NADH dehydrogenase [ubiquinone] 1 alpha subcomplex subunit 11 isoform X2 [Canis lupus dingo]
MLADLSFSLLKSAWGVHARSLYASTVSVSAALNKVARLLSAPPCARLRAPPRKSRENERRLPLGAGGRPAGRCGPGVLGHGAHAPSAVPGHPRWHRVPPQDLRQHRRQRRRWPGLLCLQCHAPAPGLFPGGSGEDRAIHLHCSAQVREKPDDPLNYFIGGCAGGLTLGARTTGSEPPPARTWA